MRRGSQELGVEGKRGRGLTPLVGREHEVGLLRGRWVQIETGQGHIVMLSGEAGIGKSRLVQVVKDEIIDATALRIECRCFPYHQRIAQVLEARFHDLVDTQPVLLAQHCTEAGQSARAIAHWRWAGEHALQRSANLEAISHLSEKSGSYKQR